MLADGGTVRIRPIRPDDERRCSALYERLSDESVYLRFFSPVPRADGGAARAADDDRLRRRTWRWSPSSATRSSRSRATTAPATGEAEVAFTVARRPAGPRARRRCCSSTSRSSRAANGIHDVRRRHAAEQLARCSTCSPPRAGQRSATSTTAPSASGSRSSRPTTSIAAIAGTRAPRRGRVDRAAAGAAFDRGDRREPARRARSATSCSATCSRTASEGRCIR